MNDVGINLYSCCNKVIKVNRFNMIGGVPRCETCNEISTRIPQSIENVYPLAFNTWVNLKKE